MASKLRLDELLAARGLFESRSKAAGAVLAGEVRLGPDAAAAGKPGMLVWEDVEVVVAERPRYASRGGIKLERALDSFQIDVAGRLCLDVGASTGGFSDCLLQRGAARVVAVDVAYGELDWRLRNDERVTVLERTNARALRPQDLPYTPDLAVVDVSFIGLAKVLPSVIGCMADGFDLIALVKPQFEVGRERVGKGGVVRDPMDRHAVLVRAGETVGQLGLSVRGYCSSGLPGPAGNRESFIWCGDGRRPGLDDLHRAALAAEPEAGAATGPRR
jgi:23S rRNA (cytidine1920-2'-O)/16S rRNA (cytidine1409-2'-O)-methyltransferase